MKHLDVKKLKVGVNVLKEGVYVYKKVRMGICQLYIPKGAKVLKTWGKKYKLRTNEAIVIMIVPAFTHYRQRFEQSNYHSLNLKQFSSLHNLFFSYKLGKRVKPQYGLDENPYKICSSGIYFWETLKKAENY